MKFGIKILICNLILLLVLFGVGGGLLVWHSYRLALDSAVDNGLEENQLLRSVRWRYRRLNMFLRGWAYNELVFIRAAS